MESQEVNMSDNPLVCMVMGSDSDLTHLEDGISVLRASGIPFEVRVLSAHRTPDDVRELAQGARDRGVRIFLAAAGGAAHLAGAVAASTTLPVVGIPIPSSSLDGLDALLSTVQMPGGIPVASMGIGRSGGVNAALFALSILSLSDESVADYLAAYRQEKAEKVRVKDQTVRNKYAGGAS
jgi:phosphoribosylaminoimidazole carboxylase PurE protein